MISFADDRLHLLFGGRYDWADIGNGFPWLSFYGNFTQSFGLTNAIPIPGQPVFPRSTGRNMKAARRPNFLTNVSRRHSLSTTSPRRMFPKPLPANRLQPRLASWRARA
jgi:hypothetical protein